MKALTTIAAAALLATNVHANSCAEARTTTQELVEDFLELAQEVEAGKVNDDNIELYHRRAARRVRSIESSLIGLRVWCHDNSTMLRWANTIEDAIDEFKAAVQ